MVQLFFCQVINLNGFAVAYFHMLFTWWWDRSRAVTVDDEANHSEKGGTMWVAPRTSAEETMDFSEKGGTMYPRASHSVETGGVVLAPRNTTASDAPDTSAVRVAVVWVPALELQAAGSRCSSGPVVSYTDGRGAPSSRGTASERSSGGFGVRGSRWNAIRRLVGSGHGVASKLETVRRECDVVVANAARLKQAPAASIEQEPAASI